MKHANSSNNFAIVILTIPSFHHEAKLIADRLISLEFTNYFNCYLASHRVDDFTDLVLSNWKLIGLPDGFSWGQDIINIIDSLSEEYVFLMLDDFYITYCSPISQMLQSLESAINLSPYTIRLTDNFNSRLMPQRLTSEIYCESYPHRYIASLVFPIFQKSFLRSIVHPDDSPWSFEKNAKYLFKFTPSKHLRIVSKIHAVNLVVKGRSLRSSYSAANKFIGSRLRPAKNHTFMPYFIEIFYHLKRFLHRLLMKYDLISYITYILNSK